MEGGSIQSRYWPRGLQLRNFPFYEGVCYGERASLPGHDAGIQALLRRDSLLCRRSSLDLARAQGRRRYPPNLPEAAWLAFRQVIPGIQKVGKDSGMCRFVETGLSGPIEWTEGPPCFRDIYRCRRAVFHDWKARCTRVCHILRRTAVVKGVENFAERVGFEPTIPLPVYHLSRVASSTAPAPLQMQNHIFSLAANKESHPRLVRCGHGECGQFSAACPAGGGTADAPPAQTAPAPLQICCFLAKYRMITAEMQWKEKREIETTAAIPYIRTRNELPPRNDTLSPD